MRGEVQALADVAGDDPLVRAAERWRTLRKFAPALIEALEFRTARAGDPMLAALKLLVSLDQSGKRDLPADAPMPFRKEWRRPVLEQGRPNRRYIYRHRNLIERYWARLKKRRAVATRYDKTAICYAAGIAIAASPDGIKSLI